MTDEQIINTYNKMVELYGDKLPNPEHCPKEFAYYVKLFQYFENADSAANHPPQANS